MTVRNDQLAQFAFDAAAYEGVRGEAVNRGLDRNNSSEGGIRILVAQESECALNVIERAR